MLVLVPGGSLPCEREQRLVPGVLCLVPGIFVGLAQLETAARQDPALQARAQALPGGEPDRRSREKAGRK